MPMTLSSNSFVLTKDVDIKDILSYTESVVSNYRDKSGVVLEISIHPDSDKRVTKNSIAQSLDSAILPEYEIWEQFEYSFKFKTKKYHWKGIEIHITAGEALFLYHWLVQGKYCNSESYYLYNLRKRYGNEFLEEVR